jgi:cobalt/nickel transport system permease protein
MHIPDGFLSPAVWTSLTAISICGIGMAIRKTKVNDDQSQIPLIGVTTAFIFAAQMINFPVAGATSGHLTGSTLAAILFGPWMSMLIMTAVIMIQSIFFQDGGITAMGANLFNVAIVAPWIGYGIYKLFSKTKYFVFTLSGVFIASWISVVTSSALVGIELALSGLVPLGLALMAMITWHSLIGLGEGIITVVVIKYLIEREKNSSYLPIQVGVKQYE